MKKNDITAIVLIVMLSLVVSYILASTLIGSPKNDPVQVEVVTPISKSFPAPDSRIFNDKAIDPTVDIKGDGASNRPFSN